MSQLLERRLKAFAYHRPSPPVQEKMAALRTELQDLGTFLDETLPDSGDAARYTALAFTALEECAMWAMKALSHGDPEGEQVSP